MPDPSFADLWAQVSRDPQDRQVSVPPIQIDLTPNGIVSRLRQMMDAAKQAGLVNDADHHQFSDAAKQMSGVLGRMDTAKMLPALRANPSLGGFRLPEK